MSHADTYLSINLFMSTFLVVCYALLPFSFIINSYRKENGCPAFSNWRLPWPWKNDPGPENYKFTVFLQKGAG
jgi:hypothetical protein